ncbi:MAG TPA: hypothetical protein VEH04_04265 [Verrucomicrobiae bacterium]|nr:hypothetical protein [Verrucomicrobiae bacterium]
MRTKNLLLSAAAVVAGAISAQAQSNVYSVNIVGYVNKPIAAGQFTLLANPLNDGTNTIGSLGAALPNKTTVQVWNGTGFVGTSKAGGVWGNPNLPIPPGTGFFVQTPAAGATVTNTFVGSVVIGYGQTNSMALPSGFSLVGSPVPIAGTLNSAGPNTLNLGNSLPNKSTIQVWNGTTYVGTSKAGGTWGQNLQIDVAQGFFVNTPVATNWSQTLQ